eukprot:maker-scaffold872_size86337-snap-gene-0.16 protein:Tk06107 transcript:maker-scaffold872_size86337-snap-gene-0.16-mRNA-1 annotation:"rho-related gtp-binding protein"
MRIGNLPATAAIDRQHPPTATPHPYLGAGWSHLNGPKPYPLQSGQPTTEHVEPGRPQHFCSLAVVGDPKVGKTTLINRVLSGTFSDQPIAGSTGRRPSSPHQPWQFNVAGKLVQYSIWDLSGTSHLDLLSQSDHLSPGQVFPETLGAIIGSVDVVLLCYNIADPDSLFSALNCWCPKLRRTLTTKEKSPTRQVPIILVGCQSDSRQERDFSTTSSSSSSSPGSTLPPRRPRRPLSFSRDDELDHPVPANQALKLSQQSGCSLYVETSARDCSRSALSAFEVAALVTLGQFNQHQLDDPQVGAPPIPPKSVKISPPVPPKPRRAVSQMALNKENIYSPEPLKQKSVSRINIFPSSPKLSLKTAKSRSSASMLSLSGQRTPKIPRKSSKQERMITIKCQRLNSAKEYEEVEVEVPEPVYETLKFQNDPNAIRSDGAVSKSNKKNTFTAKIRSMFLKT